MSRPRLVVITGPLAGEIFDLETAEPFTIGRHPSNRLQIRDSPVSRQQCEIRRKDGRFLLEDLDSRHGTFVNGVQVHKRLLEDGDYLRVGESLLRFLSVRDQPSAATQEPTPSPPSRDWLAAESTVRMTVIPGPKFSSEKLLAALGSGAEAGRRLQALMDLSTGIQRVRGRIAVAGRVVDWVLGALPGSGAALFSTDPWDGELKALVDRRGEEGNSPGSAAARRVLEGGEAAIFREPMEGAEGGFLAAPLISGGRPNGVLYVESRVSPCPFDASHLRLAAAAAGIAAVALDNARWLETLETENHRLRSAELDHDMIGESPALEKMLQFIGRVAPTDSTVLLRGESGTGKELVAMAMHRNSRRAAGPFVALNCATLTESLLESELFGHERGAFTGAISRKAGKFELADGGTIFLDELGDLPVGLQAKLLRVLESRQFERVGGNRPIRVDVRLVAATHQNLEAAIRDGKFRQDLYFRLNVISLVLPPLRQRREDIPLLARHFTDHFSRKVGRRVHGLAPKALEALLTYDWPGNVRELANAVERAVVLGESERLEAEDLPETVLESSSPLGPDTPSSPGFHQAVADAKRRLILEAAAVADGNLTRAAEDLGLNPTYLHRLIRNLGLRDQL